MRSRSNIDLYMWSDLPQAIKYDYVQDNLNLDPPRSRERIAASLGMDVKSLYSLVYREKKRRAKITQQVDLFLKPGLNLINSINLATFKDYLREYPEYEDNAYLLKRLTIHKKPLQSNCMKIFESLRDMLKRSEL